MTDFMNVLNTLDKLYETADKPKSEKVLTESVELVEKNHDDDILMTLKDFYEANEIETPGNILSIKFSDLPDGWVGLISYSGKRHTIWCDNGLTSVIEWENNCPMSYDELKKIVDASIAGKKICSKCHKIIKPGEPVEYYFAGVYCSDCWDEAKAMDRAWDYSHLD